MKKLSLIILFAIAFLERTIFNLGPNIELVTLAMILSAAYLGGKQSFWLTLAIIASTDILIGNSNIFIFTWSGFLIPALIVSKLFSKYELKGLKKSFQGIFLGAGSTFFFFIWTNFGVWLLDSWGMYPKTFSGLMMSYLNALPFYKTHLISTVFFVTAGLGVIEVMIYIEKIFELKKIIKNQIEFILLQNSSS